VEGSGDSSRFSLFFRGCSLFSVYSFTLVVPFSVAAPGRAPGLSTKREGLLYVDCIS